MLKHMLTTECPRRCSYCITRNINVEQNKSIFAMSFLYEKLQQLGHHSIMLTGGEPTCDPDFYMKAHIAKKIFEQVHVTTQNREMINGSHYINERIFSSIMYSLHDGLTDEHVRMQKVRVYASILSKMYSPDLPAQLKERGFAGLTINEDQRETIPFTQDVPDIKDFSFKINRAGHCMTETIILPDLTIITDFTPYL